MWENPTMSNVNSVDFAEQYTNIVVRVGTGSSISGKNGAISFDYGTPPTLFVLIILIYNII